MEFNNKYDAVMQVKKDRVLLARAGLRQTRYIKDFPNLVVAEFESKEDSRKFVLVIPIGEDHSNEDHWKDTHWYIDLESSSIIAAIKNVQTIKKVEVYPKGYEKYIRTYGTALEDILTCLYLEGYTVGNINLEECIAVMMNLLNFNSKVLAEFEQIKSKPYYLENGDTMDDY